MIKEKIVDLYSNGKSFTAYDLSNATKMSVGICAMNLKKLYISGFLFYDIKRDLYRIKDEFRKL